MTVSARPGMTLHQATAWPDAAQALARALAQAAGAPPPAQGFASVGRGGVLVRSGPLSWWVIDGPDPAPPQSPGTCVDLTGGRVSLTVRGRRAAALPGRLTAMDLRDAAFQPGAFAMTGTAHMALALRRLDALGYALYVPRSCFEDFRDFLMLHGLQFGVTNVSAPVGARAP